MCVSEGARQRPIPHPRLFLSRGHQISAVGRTLGHRLRSGRFQVKSSASEQLSESDDDQKWWERASHVVWKYGKGCDRCKKLQRERSKFTTELGFKLPPHNITFKHEWKDYFRPRRSIVYHELPLNHHTYCRV